MMFGYYMAGVAGSVACLLGMILPLLAILAIIAYFYTAFRQNPYILSEWRECVRRLFQSSSAQSYV